MSQSISPETVVTPDAWMSEVPWIDKDECDIDAYVNALPVLPDDFDLAEKLHSWHEEGVVVFEQAVSGDLIDSYLEDIDTFVRDYNAYDVPIEVRGEQKSSFDLDGFPDQMTGVKLNHMHCFSRAAARLSLTPVVSEFLGHVFGEPASVCQSLTFWRGSEQPIHIDYPYVRQQKKLSFLAASWVPLEDIHPESGPLAYYPGGHRLDNSGFFDWGGGSIIYDEHSIKTPVDFAHYLAARMAEKGIPRRQFCPKRGDVLLWHGNLPHEGTGVRNKALTRKSYVTHYTAESALPEWMRNYDQHGRPIGVFENGGNSYRYRWFDDAPTLPSWSLENG